LAKHGWTSMKKRWDAARAKKSSMGWSRMLKVYEDVCEKKPDMFVWIICARDLTKVKSDHVKRICWSKVQCEWSARNPYADQSYLADADGFLEKLKTLRKFEVHRARIETNGDFPSTYHFRICDFTC